MTPCWGTKRDCPSRGPCGCTGACLKPLKPGDMVYAYGRAWEIVPPPKPIVCLPLMTKPTREVEKGTKYLPEVWRPND